MKGKRAEEHPAVVEDAPEAGAYEAKYGHVYERTQKEKKAAAKQRKVDREARRAAHAEKLAKEKAEAPVLARGTPRIEFTAEQIYHLALIGCTYKEMGGVLGCSAPTICQRLQEDAEYKAAYDKGWAEKNVSLRRLQRQQAETSVPMSMHIGKQPEWLDQRDRLDAELTGKDGGAIAIDWGQLPADQITGFVTILETVGIAARGSEGGVIEASAERADREIEGT